MNILNVIESKISNINSYNRIIINSLSVVFRLIMTIICTFITTKIVLTVLGQTQYGLFSLINSFLIGFMLFNNSLIISVQRFLSYNSSSLCDKKKIFFNSKIIHFLLGVVFILLGFVLNDFILNCVLNIPDQNMPDCKFAIYSLSLFIGLTIILTPYQSLLVSDEKIIMISISVIFCTAIKLIISIVLLFLPKWHFKVYIFLFSFLYFLEKMFYYIFCFGNPVNTNSFKNLDFQEIKKILIFSFWNLLEFLGGFARNQGVVVLLNNFFTPIHNAAYNISFQISGQIVSFCSSIARTVNPQIISSEGLGQRDKMFSLSSLSSKMGTFFFLVIALPVFVNIKSLLQLWLGNYPFHSIVMTKMILIYFFIRELTNGLKIGIQAIGRIKKYSIIVTSILISTFFISLFLLKIKFSFHYLFIVIIIAEVIINFFVLFYFKKISKISISCYVKNVIIKNIIIVLGLYFLLMGMNNLITIDNLFVAISLKTFIVMIIFIPLELFIVFDFNERIVLKKFFLKFCYRQRG